ncbi:hypothetical protein B7486_71600 [cyanobacterium TDX16]|nr:hypothetical protein B7486_71600 [cyanobacterium TDX16]
MFDAGALIALERADRRLANIVGRLDERSVSIIVPTTALAQVLRDRSRQVVLNRLLRNPSTVTVELDQTGAIRVGELLRRAGTTDVVDAHVVLCGLERRQAIVTSDPDDLRRLDPAVRLIEV